MLIFIDNWLWNEKTASKLANPFENYDVPAKQAQASTTNSSVCVHLRRARKHWWTVSFILCKKNIFNTVFHILPVIQKIPTKQEGVGELKRKKMKKINRRI